VIVERGAKLPGAGVAGATAVSWIASIVIFGYFADWAGLTIVPFPILAWSVGAAAATFLWLWRDATWLAGELGALAGVIQIVLAWPPWLTWPEVLPLGGSLLQIIQMNDAQTTRAIQGCWQGARVRLSIGVSPSDQLLQVSFAD
jgi:hypothetical protein